MGFFASAEQEFLSSEAKIQAQRLQSYFKHQGLKGVHVEVKEAGLYHVQLHVRPTVSSSIMADMGDFFLAGMLAKTMQKAGFIMGELASSRDKPPSVRVDATTIEAPNLEILSSFLDKSLSQGYQRDR